MRAAIECLTGALAGLAGLALFLAFCAWMGKHR